MNLHASMEAFVEVARTGGFSSAARQLKLSTTSVSRLVADLEDKLGVALLRRSTRKVSLTEAGALYLSQAAAILEEIRVLNAAVGDDSNRPRGILRITMPPGSMATLLPPKIITFANLYPEIILDVDITARVVDMVGEGFDLAVRGGPLTDSSLVVQHFMDMPYRVVASPDYLSSHPDILVPGDVSAHACIQWRGTRLDYEWRFQKGAELETVPIRCRVMINDLQARRDAALAGIGLAILPDFFVQEELEVGRLKTILPDYDVTHEAFYFVRPPAPFVPAKLRAFIDFMRAEAAKN